MPYKLPVDRNAPVAFRYDLPASNPVAFVRDLRRCVLFLAESCSFFRYIAANFQFRIPVRVQHIPERSEKYWNTIHIALPMLLQKRDCFPLLFFPFLFFPFLSFTFLSFVENWMHFDRHCFRNLLKCIHFSEDRQQAAADTLFAASPAFFC